jgi:hypothetical protein
MFTREVRLVLAGFVIFPIAMAIALFVESRVLAEPVLLPAVASLFPQAIRSIIQRPLAIFPISPVELIPTGEASVNLTISRHGRSGPVAIDVTGLPEGITASVQPIAGEESTTRIDFFPSETLGDNDVESHVTVRAAIAKDSATQEFVLRVPRVSRPSFAPLDKTVLLKPGMEEAVAIRVRRNGFDGPLVIRALDPPPGVDIAEAHLQGGASLADLHVFVTNDAAEGRFPIALTMSAYGRTIVTDLPLIIDSVPYRMRSLRVVRLQPGGTVSVDVPVERNSYSGAIRVAAVGLPAHVTSPDSVVPAGQKTASLQFQAGPLAMPGVQAVTIQARAGQFEDEGTLVLRVIDNDDDGSLPREVVAVEAIGRISGVGSLGSRTSATGKKILGQLYGNSVEDRAAIANGLDWLSQGQMEDGAWSLDGRIDSKSSSGSDPSADDDRVAATALALLPYLAEGITHRRTSINGEEPGSYRKLVERGIRFLLRSQTTSQDDANGLIGSTLMSHALATLTLAEAYGLTKDDRLKPFLKSAIAYLLTKQSDDDGGWRGQPDGPEELPTTAWVVMALRNARYAHVAVPSKALARAKMYIEDCSAGPATSRQSLYADMPGGQATPTATATALFIRQLLGWPKSEPALTAGCVSIMRNLPAEIVGPVDDIDLYFFATQVLKNMEGDDFDLWHHLVRKHLILTQEQDGSLRGSWRPSAEAAGLRASRVYTTALSLLTLQVSYRHLPLYRPVTLRIDDPLDEDADDPDDEQDVQP